LLSAPSFHDPRTAGVLFSADAVGSIFGGVLALSLARRVRPARLSLIGFAADVGAIRLLTVATPLPLAIAAMFLFGIGGPLGVSPMRAADDARARGHPAAGRLVRARRHLRHRDGVHAGARTRRGAHSQGDHALTRKLSAEQAPAWTASSGTRGRDHALHRAHQPEAMC
jgi:hypothetical protein